MATMATSRRVVIVLVSWLLIDVARADDADPPTGRFEVGAGFGAERGFFAHAAVVQDDLFDTGQRLALSADVSARWQRFRLEHGVDDVLGSGLDLDTELFSERRVHTGFTREGHGGAVTLTRALGARTRAYLRYRAELVDLDVDGAGAVSRSIGGLPLLGDGLQATLRSGVVHDTLDAPVLPRHGTRVEAYAETADRALGSDHEWRALGASLDHARPVGPLTLRVHGHADYVHGAPLSARLQHDGHVDGIGYPVGSLDALVVTPDGTVAAGDNLEALGRVELELPVWRKVGLSVAAFGEVAVRGNTDPAWGATAVGLYRSAGASVIWRSPIGVLRFDWVLPFDGEDREPKFVFSMGGLF